VNGFVTVDAISPILRSIIARQQEQDRRLAGGEVRGKVTEVNASEAWVRLEIGKDTDGNPVLSPKTPYKQTAGALKLHSPPSVGQTMAIRSDSGDIEQGIAEAFHWSDENSATSTDGEAHKLTYGGVTVDLTAGGMAFTLPELNITGNVNITGNFNLTGDYNSTGTMMNAGKDVGSTHTNLGLPVD
jgi:phage baseplate assembly protein gpV